MDVIINISNYMVGSLILLMGILAVDSTIREKEWRAFCISLPGVLTGVSVFVFLIMEGEKYRELNMYFLLTLFITGVVSLTPFRFFKPAVKDMTDVSLFDERDHMFARNALKDCDENYREYYEENKDKLEHDKRLHAKEDLEHPSQLYYDKYHTPIFEAAFTYLDRVRFASEGPVKEEKVDVDPEKLTHTVKEICMLYGAVDVGITELKPWHFYSHRGRRAEGWGEEIERRHKYGVSIVVKMEPDLIKKAPSVSAIVESSHQYVEAGKIANVVAHYLRALGYDSNANVDGNYETLCVPVSIDSGMGVLSRMGLLMHPVYGPCVRISVVTTDAELLTDTPADFAYMEDFCRICKKCAHNCPTKSIPEGEEPEGERGFRHWHIDQEKCFALWKSVGTDCGFCISVCPYTKPNTLFHTIVRFFISRNPVNRRIALFFDDLLYGRRMKIPQHNPVKIIDRYSVKK